MWHHTRAAKRELKDLASGYDSEDKELSSSDIRNKYQGSILEEKAKSFRKLSIDDQKELLYTGITGEDTATARKIREAPFVQAVIMGVQFYTRQLKKMGRYEKENNGWLNKSCDYKTFIGLPLEEKKKFHNAMVNFHDQCIRENKEKGQSLVTNQILDSSPADKTGGCPPDFDDSSKWSKIKK